MTAQDILDGKQLVANARVIRSANDAAMKFEDENMFPVPNRHFLDTREKLTGGQRALARRDSIHDAAQANPLVRGMLERLRTQYPEIVF